MQIKLLIACKDERQAVLLDRQLAREREAGIAANTTGLATLLVRIATDRPDVVLLDQSLFGDDAHQILRPLRALSPATRVLVLSGICTYDLMLAFIKLGADGCVLTSDPPARLAKAVRTVHGGGTWFEHATLLQAVHCLIDIPVTSTPVDERQLTQREEEIFDLMGRGLTNKEIARELEISDLTVKTHLHRIYVKLHQSGRHKALLSHPGKMPF